MNRSGRAAPRSTAAADGSCLGRHGFIALFERHRHRVAVPAETENLYRTALLQNHAVTENRRKAQAGIGTGRQGKGSRHQEHHRYQGQDTLHIHHPLLIGSIVRPAILRRPALEPFEQEDHADRTAPAAQDAEKDDQSQRRPPCFLFAPLSG